MSADTDAQTPFDQISPAVPLAVVAVSEPASRTRSDGGWTIPLVCIGIGVIACCVIIPQTDANRRLVYEREKLKLDLQYVDKQLEVNDEFLRKVADDPTLAERLAQRQMKMVREGTNVLELRGQSSDDDKISPFLLVNVPAPAPLPAYRPSGGMLGKLVIDQRMRLYLMGGALMLIAVGIVCGASPVRQ